MFQKKNVFCKTERGSDYMLNRTYVSDYTLNRWSISELCLTERMLQTACITERNISESNYVFLASL